MLLSFLFEMPDIIIIIPDRSVAGEEPASCDVHKRLSLPPCAVFIVEQGSFLNSTVAFQIEQRHEPVFVDQVFLQLAQHLLITDRQHFRSGDEVNALMNGIGADIEVAGMVCAVSVHSDDFIARSSEDVDVVIADQVADLNVGTVCCSQGDRAV